VGYLFHLNIPYALAWSVVVGGLGQFLMQQPALKRFGFSWRGPWSFKDKGVARMGLLMLPTAFGAAVYQLNIVIGTLLASYLPVRQHLLPLLRRPARPVPAGRVRRGRGHRGPAEPVQTGHGRHTGRLHRHPKRLLRLTLFICLPAAAGLIALADPMVRVLFGRGAFGAHAVAATAGALVAYGVGLPAFACVRPLYSAYFALADTRTPAITAAVCLVVYVATGLALMDPLGHVGLALATSVSSWVNVAVLGIILRKKLGGTWFAPGRTTLVSTLLSCGVGAGAAATAGHPLLSLLLIAGWAVGYMLVASLLHVEEARLLTDFAWRRIRRGRKEASGGRGE